MSSFTLIEPSVDYIDAPDLFDKIALVAHNCYQVTARSHEQNVAFVKRLIENKHLAMIEHQRFIFRVTGEYFHAFQELDHPFIRLVRAEKTHEDIYLVSCSLRPMLESSDERSDALFHHLERALPDEIRSLFPDLPLGESADLTDLESVRLALSDEQIDALSFYTYHIITDRGVTHELVRHRTCSFAQESTRYCNYTKDRFSNQLIFIKPLRYDEFSDIYDHFYQTCADAYFELIDGGAKPQEARSVLPNSLKTSIMVSADMQEWKHIFELRCSPSAHPDISEVMNMVRDDMIARGFLR